MCGCAETSTKNTDTCRQGGLGEWMPPVASHHQTFFLFSARGPEECKMQGPWVKEVEGSRQPTSSWYHHSSCLRPHFSDISIVETKMH